MCTAASCLQFFGGSHQAVWDFMPLITTVLDSIKAFADFVGLHNITQNAAGLPELLKTDGALLKLMQVRSSAWQA